MAITIPLTSGEQAELEARAKSQGVSVDSILRKAVLQAISEPAERPPISADEFDRAFDEIADMLPEDTPVLSDFAMIRESIYSHEDDWDRIS